MRKDCGQGDAIAAGAAALRWRAKRLHDRERGGKRLRRSKSSVVSAAAAQQLQIRRHNSNREVKML